MVIPFVESPSGFDFDMDEELSETSLSRGEFLGDMLKYILTNVWEYVVTFFLFIILQDV